MIFKATAYWENAYIAREETQNFISSVLNMNTKTRQGIQTWSTRQEKCSDDGEVQ